MPSLANLLAVAKGAQAQPMAQPQPQPAQQPGQPQQTGANPLAALVAQQQQQQQQQQQPAPTHAQTVAAMHYFGEIKNAMRPVLDDPNLGSKNIRPKLLDAASKLLGAKVLTLPEIMNKIKNLPADPIQQKQFVENIFATANKAEALVLQHHANAPPEPEGADPWSIGNQQQHITGLMQHYGGQNG